MHKKLVFFPMNKSDFRYSRIKRLSRDDVIKMREYGRTILNDSIDTNLGACKTRLNI